MRILIAGGSGFIGRALRMHLHHNGHEVHTLVRCMPQNNTEHYWDPEVNIVNPAVLENFTAIINLAGSNMGERHWVKQKEYKEKLFTSRIKTTQTLIDGMRRTIHPPKCFINASAIGFYGNRPEEKLTESSVRGTGFLPDLCVAWEKTANSASTEIRTILLRTGIVIDPSGGVLQKMRSILKTGIIESLGSAETWWSWISLEDEVRAIEFLLTQENISGPVNLVSPNPVTISEFFKTLNFRAGKKTTVAISDKVLKPLLGEVGKEFVFSNQQVNPEILQNAGFQYTYPDLKTFASGVIKNK